jgi:hypothetical protein
VLAYGRDPYFTGWPDTLQLDFSNPAMQEAMVGHGGPGPVGAPQKVTCAGRGQMSLAGKAGARG